MVANDPLGSPARARVFISDLRFAACGSWRHWQRVAATALPYYSRLQAGLRVALHLEAKAGSVMLIPLRDAMSVAVWAASFVARDVDWRGQRLELDAEGEILES